MRKVLIANRGEIACRVIRSCYDPMIAKIIGYGSDRSEAIGRTIAALEAIRVDGLKINLQFLTRVLQAMHSLKQIKCRLHARLSARPPN